MYNYVHIRTVYSSLNERLIEFLKKKKKKRKERKPSSFATNQKKFFSPNKLTF